MKDHDFLYAINDIDDGFIVEADDDEKLKEAFCLEWAQEDNNGFDESEQTHSDAGEKEKHKPAFSTKRKITKRLLLVAVISALVIALSVGTLAKYYDINLRDEIYEIIGKTVQVDRRELSADPDKNIESSGKLVDDLKEKGFENILLPKAILSDDWQFVYVQFYDYFPTLAGANINLITQKGETSFILSYFIYEEYKSNEENYKTVVKMEEINISGVDVIVTLHENGNKSINYVTREEKDSMTAETNYFFSFSSDYTYEEVIEIAKTIG